jgi:hypothetical protein
VAAVAGLALLAALLHALDTAARLGDLRRKAVAAHLQASWQCHALRGAQDRADCLARLPPVPRLNAELRAAPTSAP